jgi:hypothetical protein
MMPSILKSVIQTLKNTYPDHKIYEEKVTQGLKRPCFFVDIIPIALEKESPNRQDRSLIVDIQYMSFEDTKVKNLEMAESLGQLFNSIEFDNFKVNPSNERFEVVDGILHYLFDLDFLVIGSQEDSSDLIGEININREVL